MSRYLLELFKTPSNTENKVIICDVVRFKQDVGRMGDIKLLV